MQRASGRLFESTSYRRRFSLALGVLLLAALLRLWQISQIPPGLHYDEAFMLLRAQEVAQGQSFPAYFPGDNPGADPVFIYLSVLPLLILGPVAWAGRLAGAWAGILSVAAVIRLGSEFFPKRWVGVLAGFTLAILYWHVHFSRLGMQQQLPVTAACCTLAAFWHAARTGQRWAYVLAGVSLGLGLATYLSFRFFPLVLLVAGLALLLTRPKALPQLVWGGSLTVVVALIVWSPEALFFIQNPVWFFSRYNAVTQATFGAADPGRVLIENMLKVAGSLLFQGDLDWHHNLSGRPILDPVQGLFFLLGLGLALRDWRKPTSLTLGLWLSVSLSLSVITEYAPHFARTLLAAPAVALFTGLGLEAIGQWAGRWTRPLLRGLIFIALGLASVYSTYRTVNDYFFRWARDPHLFVAFEEGLQWVARELRAAPANAALIETPVFREWTTLEYTLGKAAYQRFKYFNGRECFLAPAQTTVPTTYAVIVSEDPLTLPQLEQAFPAGKQIAREMHGDIPYAVIYAVPAGQKLAAIPVHTLRYANYSGIVALRGYTLDKKELKPGDTLRLAVAWEAQKLTPAAYALFIHVHGLPKSDGSILYAQRDAQPCDNSYPSWQWSPGDMIVDRYSIPLPSDIPPGDYTLQAGWYDSGTLERLPASDQAGQSLGDIVELEHITIQK